MESVSNVKMTPKGDHQRSKSEEMFTSSKIHNTSLKHFSNLNLMSNEFKNLINNIGTNLEKKLRELSAKKMKIINKDKKIESNENNELGNKIEENEGEFNLKNLNKVEYQDNENEKLKKEIASAKI